MTLSGTMTLPTRSVNAAVAGRASSAGDHRGLSTGEERWVVETYGATDSVSIGDSRT
jgi:hypothetical protein